MTSAPDLSAAVSDPGLLVLATPRGADAASFKDESCCVNSVMTDQSMDGSLSASSSPRKGNLGSFFPSIPAATPRNLDNDHEHDDDDSRIRLGICAIDKKARSRPMAEILSRLDENLFRVVFFGDAILRDQPASEWPICDVLIAFYSKGYPLHKAKEYVQLRQPFLLNDLDMQELLQDRRRVYDLLEGSGIDVPRHVYLSRDGYVSTGSGDGDGSKDQEVKEFDDHIIVNGVLVNKPFVEKPVNAEGETQRNKSMNIYFTP
jgi:inositol-hexakisphosphate/diphosphoinositol-pentakisphosphate 1-kinase